MYKKSLDSRDSFSYQNRYYLNVIALFKNAKIGTSIKLNNYAQNSADCVRYTSHGIAIFWRVFQPIIEMFPLTGANIQILFNLLTHIYLLPFKYLITLTVITLSEMVFWRMTFNFLNKSYLLIQQIYVTLCLPREELHLHIGIGFPLRKTHNHYCLSDFWQLI